MKRRREKRFLNGIVGCFFILLTAVPAFPFDLEFFVKQPDGTPISSLRVTVFSEFPYTWINQADTDSNGYAHINTGGGGSGVCIQIVSPGWIFTDPSHRLGPGPLPGFFCVNTDLIWDIVGTKSNFSGNVRVYGGPQGYVNPNANEVATIVFVPRTTKSKGGPHVTLKIYTLQGRLVTSKEQFAKANVMNSFVWDCTNANGEKVASGIYIAHIFGDGNINQWRKIAVVRK